MSQNIQKDSGFEPFKGIDTLATHAGYNPREHESLSCPAIPPISLSTTFYQKAPGEHFGFDYSRAGNPTRDFLEKALATLEGARFAAAFSSGLAVQSALVQQLKSGDSVICNDDVYGGTNRYFRTISSNAGIKTHFVNLATDLPGLAKCLQSDSAVRMVWIETPTNPLMKLIDVRAVSEAVKKVNKDILVVCDNTFLSPVFQRPLELGADVVMHSMTKYINGHSDVVMGCCMTNSAQLHEWLTYNQKSAGATPSPFDCWLAHRGLRTLPLRMRQHMANGLAVARHLEASRHVDRVLHPGLESHPQHQLAKRQQRGYSGMVSAYLRVDASAFVSALRLFTLAESLGGFESLAEVPSIMTHASVPPDQRAELGITDSFVRLSVGLEDIDDLLADLDQALEKAAKPATGDDGGAASDAKRRRTSKNGQ
uniref:cystathionine gamma-lyase n=1 Tax=Macrostomum lignano TaxID=282301 RepID=A0A1I8HZA9_9PLAT